MTWEEKIDSLVRLAKLAGSYIDAKIDAPNTDGYKDAWRRLKEAYDAFCDWRHDEPYVVDEIKALIEGENSGRECGII